jgi:hypothetical protein
MRAALCVVAAIVAWFLGDSIVERLPNHQGYFLVKVEDRVESAIDRPRYSVLILIDGMGRSFAEKLRSVERLRAKGQCRRTDVGPLTVSRPVYAVVSTGLEQDRTGSRNNDEKSPLAADSIFEAARRTGRTVHGISTEEFWQQLFPEGFDKYSTLERSEDQFTQVELANLTLIHPLYVDDAGHSHGAASKEYADAVARADKEIGELLDRVDLSRDLVVLTADHGHMSYGGHGGPQEELRFVLTCFAGKGVRRSDEEGPMDARSIAPAIAVIAGLPFPENMRAVEDDLDVVFQIADTGTLSVSYLAEREAAIHRFREENRAQIEHWLDDGEPGTWSRLYAREERLQQIKLAIGAAVIAALAAWYLRGRQRPAASLIWCAATIGLTALVFALLRGSLTYSGINTREEFVRVGFLISIGVATIALIGHRLILKEDLAGDQVLLVGLLLGACLLHPIAYGWPLGFPLPSAEMMFFPFFAPIVLLVHAPLGAVISLIKRRA